jgi:hypothetical protein
MSTATPLGHLFDQACEEGNLTEAIYILDHHRGFYDCTDGFIIACRKGNVELVKAMQRIHDDGLFDVRGFYAACGAGQFKVVDFLLSQTANRHTQLQYMNQGLGRAALLGKLDMVMYLVERGARSFIGALDDATVKPQNTKVIRYLLSVAPPRPSLLGNTFRRVCISGCVHNVEAVLDSGPDVLIHFKELINQPKSAYLAVFKFYSKFPKDMRRDDFFRIAIHDLCSIFLGLEKKGVPKEIIRYKIFAYL